MALIVQKYGGTSVGTPERIQGVADRIAHAHRRGTRLVVVVSAMGHSTDELIALAHQVSKHPPHREMDMLLTAGERISMALLSMALADREVQAISLTGSQSGIITTRNHRRARIKRILGNRVRAGIEENKVVIVAGFQGVSEDREITTLGRGGSDTTAVALAATLGADRCEIYTDVDGVYSADPRLVPKARLWNRISHDLMVELAVRGAGVLHPRSVELAKQFQVPLWVGNSRSGDPDQKEGTYVVPAENREFEKSEPGNQDLEEVRVTGVTSDKGKMLVTVQLMRDTVMGAVCDRAAEAHLPMVASMFADGRLRYFTDREAHGDWTKVLEQLASEGFVERYEIDPKWVPVSVIGDRFAQDGTALYAVIDALARSHIEVTVGSASALAITVAVREDQADESVQALHSRFFEARKETE